LHRGKFQPWEIDILLDIESCNLRRSTKRQILQGYQRAVQAGLQMGAQLPVRLSEYLGRPSDVREPQEVALCKSVVCELRVNESTASEVSGPFLYSARADSRDKAALGRLDWVGGSAKKR
jgi:hypothetical protein